MESAAQLMSFPDILFEDNHIIAINKPSGLLSQSDGSNAKDVLNELKAFIKKRESKPGNVYVGLVHRLDRPVSGAMILAKTSKAASRLSAAFRQRKVTKTYHAVVENDVTPSLRETNGQLTHQLVRDAKTRITNVTDNDGKVARLKWRIIKTASHRSWVAVDLETGLPHQIRAQFSAVGHPIIGDRKYGAKQLILDCKGVIALYCHQLKVAHPTKDELITVTAPPPSFWRHL